MKSILTIFGDIKLQHTVFALPFAVMSAFVAAGGMPAGRTLVLLVLAVLTARAAGMTFNRIADRGFDRENPRTMNRPLAAGAASPVAYWLFYIGAAVAFVMVCRAINPLAFKLSPVAIIIVSFYSLTKRFTKWSHFYLGGALALAPLGAWIAVREEISAAPVIIALAVVFWLAGLDTIYACQDTEFDRAKGLNSLPARLGVKTALKLSALFHAVMVVLLLTVPAVAPVGWVYILGVMAVAAMLVYEHSIVKPTDLTRVNIAFFNINGLISVALMSLTILDQYLR